MKRLLTAVLTLGLLATFAAGVTALLYTGAGLQWTYARLQQLLPGQLTIEHLDGRLAGPLTLTGLHYENDTFVLHAERVVLRWQPGRLVDSIVRVDTLALDGVDLTVKPTPAPRPAAAFNVRLPLAIDLRDAHAAPVRVTLPGRAPVEIDGLAFSGSARGGRATLAALHVVAPQFTLDADGELPLNLRGRLRLALRGQGQADAQTIAGAVTLGGTWRRITADLRLTAPLVVAASGELDSGRGQDDAAPHWRLHATAEPFSPATLLPHAPPGRATDLTLQAEGNGADFSADGGLTWHDGRHGDWALTLRAVRTGAQWELPAFQLRSLHGDTSVGGHAQAHFADGAVRDYLLEAHWLNLRWPPVSGGGRAISPQGTLRLSGRDTAHYDYALSGTLQPPQVPPLTLTLSGQGDRDGVRIDTLASDWLHGRWAGQGQFAWIPVPQWDIALTAHGVDPAALRPGFDGQLDADARVRGAYLAAALSLDVELGRLGGTLRGYPLSAHTRVALRGDEVRVEDLQLRSGDASLAADARLGAEWRIDWRLHAPALAELLPEAAGALTTSGSLSGPPDALRTRLELEGQGLAWRELQARALRLNADIDLAPAGRWELRARAEDAGRGALRGGLSLDGSGTSADHTLRLAFAGEEWNVAQTLRGAWENRRWEGRLLDGRVELGAAGAYSQRGDADLALSADDFRLQDWCWRQDAAQLCLAGTGHPAARDLEAHADWSELALARLSALYAAPGIELDGRAAGEAHASVTAGTLQSLQLSLRLGAGSLLHPMPGTEQRHRLGYQQAGLELHGDGTDGLTAETSIDFDSGTRLAAGARLPQWTPAAPAAFAQQALQGHLELALNDLSLLSLLVPDLLPGDGRLQAHLALAGTTTDPQLDGEIDATLARLGVARLGLELRDVGLHAQIRQNRWQLQGALRSGPGRLALDGDGELRSRGDWAAQLALKGERVEIVRLPAARVIASPDLTLRAAPGDFAFGGTLGIPVAQLEPVLAESVAGVSDDVVIVGGESREAAPRIHVHGDLALALGDEVKIAGQGVEGRLTGRLRLLVNGLDDVNGQGEIRIVEGRYRAYGQNLSIEQGRALYAGGPIENPALDIVASRQRGDDIKVGVRVTGTAKQPLVRLFSEPAMDDADVLSYLILGRPLEQASTTEGRALYQAATSLALVGGEAIATRIGGQFDLSEVSIESGETTTDTTLVLGKSLSPRLYVRYIQGLVENTSAFQIRYRLSERWTLETESGTRSGAGADVIYTLER